MSDPPKVRNSQPDPLRSLCEADVAKFLTDPKRLTTPAAIDDRVRRFCERLSPSNAPLFLKPNPQLWSRRQYCNKNVEKMVNMYGGKAQLGYRIWYVPSLYVEAERHAVWKKPDGTLVDISYYPDGEDAILFLPAPHLDTVLTQDHLKPREGYHLKVERFIRSQRQFERRFAPPKDDTREGWEQAESFQEWQARRLKF